MTYNVLSGTLSLYTTTSTTTTLKLVLVECLFTKKIDFIRLNLNFIHKNGSMFSRFVTKHACDKQTDGRAELRSQDRTSIAASRGKNLFMIPTV